ncbi:MAG: GspH/FimT family pseudopilin [Gallionella sp.]|nr:GspH/FimT family pseudopilin [Gallionella sp.]
MHKSRGFSLIELMATVVIMGILAAVAIPSFQTWVSNSQIRTAAESIANGLQKARAEAVTRNTRTTFVLGTDSSWTVSVVTPASVIEQRLASEGSKNVTRTVLPVGATTITFNNFGLVVTNVDGSVPFTRVDLAATGGTQSLRVTIGSGGNARMCDPALPSSNPRGC